MSSSNKPNLQVRKMPASFIMGLILASAASVFFIKYSFLFLIIALMPSFAAYYGDLSATRRFYQSVIACNMAGAAPYLCELIAKGNSFTNFKIIASDMSTWLVVYSFAGMGWILVWLCPQIAEMIIDITQKGKIVRLELLQKRLVAEWGEGIETATESPAEKTTKKSTAVRKV